MCHDSKGMGVPCYFKNIAYVGNILEYFLNYRKKGLRIITSIHFNIKIKIRMAHF